MPSTLRLAALVFSSLALCLPALPALGQRCATWRAGPARGALPYELEPNARLVRWLAQLETSAGQGFVSTKTATESQGAFFESMRRAPPPDRCAMAVGPRSWLLQVALSAPEMVKALPTNPRVISDQYKVFDGAGRLRALSIGWIPRTLPDRYVTQDGATTVLRFPLRDLTEQVVYPWGEYSVLALEGGRQESPPTNLAAMVEFIASPEASVAMGDYFWVVPNNAALRRRLRIEIVDEQSQVLASTPCSTSECFPQPTNAQTVRVQAGGSTYDVCSTASRTRGPDISSACPQISSGKARVTEQGARALQLPFR